MERMVISHMLFPTLVTSAAPEPCRPRPASESAPPEFIMSRFLSPAKTTAVRKAQRHLKRRLTPSEMAVVSDWDEFPASVFARDWKGKQIAELLAERTKSDDSVAFLNSLAGAGDTIPQDRERLLTIHGGRSKRMVRTFPFDVGLTAFSRWLLRLFKGHPISHRIQVLKFGIIEYSSGCRLYVSGGVRYALDQTHWVSEQPEWWGENHVVELNELSALRVELGATKSPPWIAVQSMVILWIRAFFDEYGEEFRALTGLRQVNVTTGFDDGDVYEVRTAISPISRGRVRRPRGDESRPDPFA